MGMKSRGVYETPGGTILFEAHDILEELTLDRATSHYKETMAVRFAELVYDRLLVYPAERSYERICGQNPGNCYRNSPLKAL